MGATIVPAAARPPPAVAILGARGNQAQGPGRRLPQGQVRRRARAAKGGRYTTAEESGRYTPPIPKSVRQQPAVVRARSSWCCSSAGVAVIIVNYLAAPAGVAHGSPWDLVVGLVADRRRLRRAPPSTTDAAAPAARGERQPRRSMMVALASPPPSHMV